MFKKARKLKDPTSAERAYEYCVFLLSLRLRTEGELREKMQQRGYMPEASEGAIAQLYTQKYIDDERFAEIFVDNLKQYKYYGYMMIKQKLMTKKLPMPLIEHVLEDRLPPEEEQLIAKRYLKKEYSGTSLAKLGYEEKQKVARRLQSKGFRGQVISKLLF